MTWDILDFEDTWPHKQILQRLHEHNIDCYAADMFGDEIAWVIGCWFDRDDDSKIANALNIPKDVIYMDWEHGVVFINLYKLRAIRKGVNI